MARSSTPAATAAPARRRVLPGPATLTTFRRSNPGLRAAWTVAAVLGLLVRDAAACPYCSLSQGADTLVYIASFLIIPYVVVTFTWWWMKRILASEHEA